MNLHEFQAKTILAGRGVPIPAGQVAWTPDEAARIATELPGPRFAVKAQIQAGGRAEAGGVKLASSPDEVRTIAAGMLGAKLVTAQTSAAGRKVHRVYVEAAIDAEREIYVAVLVDRNTGKIVLLGARQGGEHIEELLQQEPEHLRRLPIQGTAAPDEAALRDFAEALGLDGALAEEASRLLGALVATFVELDLSLLEINPLSVTDRGRKLMALDVKMAVDDNALFRQPELKELRDDDEIDEQEQEAQRHDLNFVRMDGNIGVVVNGAGLALATHDILRDAGGTPANFMDIRTTAMSQQIAKGIGVLLADTRVKVILVNVHGGGMTSCDTVVDAIQIAMRWSGRKVPIVFRAAGQNADHARWAMADRRIPHDLAGTIGDAARRAVEIAGGAA
jgi:succinyl-CoA synthetase beta subunit